MYQFPSLMQRAERNAPSTRESAVSSFDFTCSLISLVSSLLVYVCTMAAIAAMVHYQYPTNWTFVCYLASSGWILIMNITSNVVIISSRRKTRREIQRPATGAASVNINAMNAPENSMREIQRPAILSSVNIERLNVPGNSRCLSSPPEIRSQLSSRIGQQCDSTSHTPPPPYEDLSLISGETGCSAQGSRERYMQLLPHPEARKEERIDYRNPNREYQVNIEHHGSRHGHGQESRELNLEGMTVRWNQHGKLTGADKGVSHSSGSAGRLMRMKFEERRNELDRRLEGDSLRKINQYVMRDLKREGKKQGPEDLRQLSEPMKHGSLNPKEMSSADNLFADVDMSRVTSAYQSRMERCELPRVHMMKSTLSLPRSPKTSSRRPLDVVKTARLNKSGLSLQDVRSKPDRIADITAANEVGLPLEKTWRQDPLRMHDRASKCSDESLSVRQSGENGSGRESGQCGTSRSNLDKSYFVRQSEENRIARESDQCSSSMNMMQGRSLDSIENEQHPSHLPKAKDLPKGFRRDEGGF